LWKTGALLVRGKRSIIKKKMESPLPPQNLIKQVRPDSVSLSPRFYKPLIFDALTIISALAFGYLYRQYLDGLTGFSILMAGLGIFAIFSALQVFFTKNLSRRFFVLLLEAALVLSFFYGYELRLLIASAIIFLFFSFWGEISSRRELENGLEIKFFRAVKPVLAKFTTALILVMVILYLPQWSEKGVFLSKDVFQKIFGLSSGFIRNFYPEIDINSGFGKLAENLARSQAEGNPAFKELPLDKKELAIKQAAESFMENLSKQLGTEIRSGDSISEVFYNYINSVVNGWRERFKDAFLAIWIFIVFLVLRSFGVVFYWLISLVSFIFFQILLSFNFMHIMGESRTHEVIEF